MSDARVGISTKAFHPLRQLTRSSSPLRPLLIHRICGGYIFHVDEYALLLEQDLVIIEGPYNPVLVSQKLDPGNISFRKIGREIMDGSEFLRCAFNFVYCRFLHEVRSIFTRA